MLTPHAKASQPAVRARVLFQLATLGEPGRAHVKAALGDADANIRVTAIRALRQNGADMVAIAKAMAKEPSPQVRRELLLALRAADSETAKDVLVALANKY